MPFSTVNPGQYRLILRRNERNPILVTHGDKPHVMKNFEFYRGDLWEGYELIIVDWKGEIVK